MASFSNWVGEDLYLQHRETIFYKESPYLYYVYRFVSGTTVAALAVLTNIILHMLFKVCRRLLNRWAYIEQVQFGMDVVFGAYHILATALTAYISERKISFLCESMRTVNKTIE